MKNRKGFTLVELLVVIAIIAILATVAIIGYTSFIKKAELSADQTAVTQLNKMLEGEEALDNIPQNTLHLKQMLVAHGYNEELRPISKGHVFCWDRANNIVLLLDENGNVVYPEARKGEVITIDGTDYCDLARVPNAIVEDISGTVIDSTIVSETGSGLPNNGASLTLDTALNFIANHTVAEAEESGYADYFVDFRITINEPLSADKNYYLAGSYDFFDGGKWVVIDTKELGGDLPAGSYLLLGDGAAGTPIFFTYRDICNTVKEFQCGISVDPTHTSLVVTLELIMFKDYESYTAGEFMVVSSSTHTFAE